VTFAIATSRIWYEQLPIRLEEKFPGEKFVLINRQEDLVVERLQELRPRYIFFPHWSYIVPAEVHENFECVIFHMTDVPFGRGGSPLQNLISRGIYETKIAALRCQDGIDAGPVYMKRPFCLHGTAEEIYMRAAVVIEDMIEAIIKNEPEPIHQAGVVVCFERRRPADGNVASLLNLEQLFDYIRMLDAEGYPKAFLETEHFRLEFQRASFKYDHVISDVKITRKGEQYG
jgi:methionyl-tRNA formyltransferase